ncbi:hypothetical protein [Desulfovibrio sp. JC010]|uniref:hypothetical protein n=1 Tax=Desulfovibrio sp. JC010 TaxID=2593641 RepID=UPI0013D1EA01|nr:hypothetical protein [Desulfovibrio sp. JC010]NDV28657.1 hypothetical protein [Desulfovibrio sp. JC010]
MRQFCLILLVLLACSFHQSAEAGTQKIISVAAVPGTEEEYRNFIDSKGGNPLAVNDFSSLHAHRWVLALTLMQQALYKGGMDAKLCFITFPNSARCLAEVKSGRTPLLASDMWEINFDDSVYKTRAIIPKGFFEKGIYHTLPSPLPKSISTLSELQKYTPLIVSGWGTDIRVLKEMGFDNIIYAPHHLLFGKMLSRKRADFTLLEFSKEDDFNWEIDDHLLYPVKDVKVVFPYSRHLMVSKQHPDGADIFNALQKGLKILDEEGTLKKHWNRQDRKTRE